MQERFLLPNGDENNSFPLSTHIIPGLSKSSSSIFRVSLFKYCLPDFNSSEEYGLIMVVCLDLEVGSGSIRLRTNDPRIQPMLDYNFLEEEFDRQRMREGVRICVELGEKKEWSELVTERVSPTDKDLSSDERLDAWLRQWVQTSHHVSGTCKMGPDGDAMSVVDQFGNVRGLENLRIADASIMPDCIRANTNVTSMVIGERVADFIRRGK